MLATRITFVKQCGNSILSRFINNERAFHASSTFRKNKEEELDEDGEKVCVPYKVKGRKTKDEYNYEYYDVFDCKLKPLKKVKRPNCWENRKALSDTKFCPVSHVIFNLDGVVLNTEEMIQNSHRKFLKRFQKKFSRDLRLRASGLSEMDAAKLIVDETEIPVPPNVYAHGARQFFRDWVSSSKLNAGVYDLVCHFKEHKIPVALESSSDQRSFDLKTKCHPDLIDMFCHVTLRSDNGVKAGKPSPDIMRISAKKFRGAPTEMTRYLAIEDSIAGAKAAKEAGMQVIMLTSRFVSEEIASKVADMVTDSLEGLDLTEFSLPSVPMGKHYG